MTEKIYPNATPEVTVDRNNAQVSESKTHSDSKVSDKTVEAEVLNTEADSGAAEKNTEADGEKRHVSLTEAELDALMERAYRRGRMEQKDEEYSQKKPERDGKPGKSTSAAELFVKGLATFAGTLLRPGRRSVWPPRRG